MGLCFELIQMPDQGTHRDSIFSADEFSLTVLANNKKASPVTFAS